MASGEESAEEDDGVDDSDIRVLGAESASSSLAPSAPTCQWLPSQTIRAFLNAPCTEKKKAEGSNCSNPFSSCQTQNCGLPIWELGQPFEGLEVLEECRRDLHAPPARLPEDSEQCHP